MATTIALRSTAATPLDVRRSETGLDAPNHSSGYPPAAPARRRRGAAASAPRIHVLDRADDLRHLTSEIEDAGFDVLRRRMARPLHALDEQPPVAVVIALSSYARIPDVAEVVPDTDLQRTVVLAAVRREQVTAVRSAEGFDDFIVHPAEADELITRLDRALKRKLGVGRDVLRAGALRIDLANYQVYIGDREVALTHKEYELLRFLAADQGKVFSRAVLLHRIWGYENAFGARTVDVHIRRLRQKIESGEQKFIRTVRNVGYGLTPQTIAGPRPAATIER
jgi:DNA-binding response OmpR family regulator